MKPSRNKSLSTKRSVASLYAVHLQSLTMNAKLNICTGLLFCLALSAGPAGAASFNSAWWMDRFDTGGTSYRNMTGTADTFCYLSRVGVTETDTGSESATCEVLRGPNIWTLEARLGRSSDADIECDAICYNN